MLEKTEKESPYIHAFKLCTINLIAGNSDRKQYFYPAQPMIMCFKLHKFSEDDNTNVSDKITFKLSL